MKATKKVLCMLLAAIFAVSVFAGCKGNGTTTSSAAGDTTSSAADSKEPGKVDTTKAVTFTLMFGEHATELYHEDTWVITPWVKEKYNVDLEITAVPASDWATKRSTTISSRIFLTC